MKKKEMLKILENINIPKEKFIIANDASLLYRGIISNIDELDIIFDDEISISNINVIKRINLNSYDEIDGYHVMKLQDYVIYNKDNKKNIKKINIYIDCQDTYKYEKELRSKGIKLIGGVDEVGRGPLVGPVVAACCILPENFSLDGLTDSKKLTEKQRNYFYEEIKKKAISYGIGIVDEKRIDEINIYEATKEAMKQAILNCNIKPEHILIDAMKLDIDIPTTPLIKGDLRSITISAASVLAKVTRDRMLYELDKKYPMYDFKNNVGYPTKKHLEAIEKYGIIDEHRKSYGPVKKYIEEKNKNRIQ